MSNIITKIFKKEKKKKRGRKKTTRKEKLMKNVIDEELLEKLEQRGFKRTPVVQKKEPMNFGKKRKKEIITPKTSGVSILFGTGVEPTPDTESETDQEYNKSNQQKKDKNNNKENKNRYK